MAIEKHATLSSWRWWQWTIFALVAVLLLLVGSAYAVRAHGLQAWKKATAEWDSLGLPKTEAEFRAQLAETDFDLAVLAAWEACPWSSKAIEDLEHLPGFDEPAVQAWLYADGPMPTFEDSSGATVPVTDLIDAARADLAAVGTLLDGPGLVLNWAAYRKLAASRTTGPLPPLPQLWDLSQWLSIRGVGLWLAWQSLIAEDPLRHLDRLDRLCAALDQPQSLYDEYLHMMTTRMRDKAWLINLRCGKIDGRSAASWLAIPLWRSPHFTRSIQYDLVLCIRPRLQAAIDMQGPQLKPRSSWGQWPVIGFIAHYCLVPQEAAILQEIYTKAHHWEMSEYRTPMPDFLAELRRTQFMGELTHNIDDTFSGLWHNEARRRATRLAARILLDLRDGTSIPADLAELNHRYPGNIGGSPMRAMLRYEHLGETQFRLGIDPAGPELVPGSASHFNSRWEVEILDPARPAIDAHPRRGRFSKNGSKK